MRRTSTAPDRHRAHHTRLAAIVAMVATLAACGPHLPRPPSTPLSTDEWIAVPFAPRTAPVEFVPPPFEGAVWVDGSWQWSGGRYAWSPGTWTVPPSGARHSTWAVVRRTEDGQLFFAGSSWKDEAGHVLDERPWFYALGPAARARAALGGEPLSLPRTRRSGGARERNRPSPVDELDPAGGAETKVDVRRRGAREDARPE